MNKVGKTIVGIVLLLLAIVVIVKGLIGIVKYKSYEDINNPSKAISSGMVVEGYTDWCVGIYEGGKYYLPFRCRHNIVRLYQNMLKI